MYIFRNQTSPFSSFSIFLSPPQKGPNKTGGRRCPSQTDQVGNTLVVFFLLPFQPRLEVEAGVRCNLEVHNKDRVIMYS